jgi:hypothetical protein
MNLNFADGLLGFWAFTRLEQGSQKQKGLHLK